MKSSDVLCANMSIQHMVAQDIKHHKHQKQQFIMSNMHYKLGILAKNKKNKTNK